MTDGERRFSCNLHVSLFYEPRKKKTSPILLKSSARLSPGKDQPTRLTWLDESLAWVLAEVALLRIDTMCMQQPASEAILRRSARSIPMFRADFLPFTSKSVEHSRYLPGIQSGVAAVTSVQSLLMLDWVSPLTTPLSLFIRGLVSILEQYRLWAVYSTSLFLPILVALSLV
jgi:hypothetical protein